MSINNVRSGGFSAPSFRSVSNEASTPAVGGQTQTALKDLQSALQQLGNNPLFKALLGQSGFDGAAQGAQGAHKGHGAHKAHGHHKGHGADKAGGADKADKANGKDSQASSQDAIKQLVDGLKKFVQVLEQMLGKKNETQDGTQAAGGTDASKSSGSAGGSQAAGGSGSAGGAEGAQQAGGSSGAGGAEGAQQAGGASGAGSAGGAEGAQQAGGADAAESSKDPITQILDTLKKIIEQLEGLMKALQTQNQGVAQNPNTGIVPPAGPTGANTGIVPPDISQLKKTSEV